jgi:mono/diheme cytochrome c family protein
MKRSSGGPKKPGKVAPRRGAVIVLAALVFALAWPGVGPAEAVEDWPGSAAAGKRLAQGWCAACHLVTAEQETPEFSPAPPFIIVAETPGVTEFWLRAFLVSPHELMPNFVLTPEETDDIVAYILSLKGG